MIVNKISEGWSLETTLKINYDRVINSVKLRLFMGASTLKLHLQSF